jgi:spore germination cell wall hydrolase CwlJ-like protein
MEKYTTNSSKWFFMMVVIVIAMFGDNNHFYHKESDWVPQAIKVTPVQKPKLQVTTIVPNWDPLQLDCLAKGIYYEARGETVKGQVAVARVIMNRVRHHSFGNTPCKVLNQANMVKVVNEEGEQQTVKVCQFSYMCEERNPVNKNSGVYQTALKIAHDVLLHDAHADMLPKNTLFFHNVNVNPNWGYKRVAVIGNHVFYAR